MKKQAQSSSDSSSEQKPQLSILSILILSLFIGLIVGAGIDPSHIFPVALITAIVLLINRNKIAARETAAPSSDRTQQNILPAEGYYAWPERGHFAVAIATESYQDAIRPLAQENAINPEQGSATSIPLKAHLIPDNDTPYGSGTVRVDIHNRTVGHLNHEQARRFHRRLDEKKLSHPITTCSAIITGDNAINGKPPIYGVKLDIEPLV